MTRLFYIILSYSSYVAPVTFAFKKDEGRKSKLCVDYRLLNKMVIPGVSTSGGHNRENHRLWIHLNGWHKHDMRSNLWLSRFQTWASRNIVFEIYYLIKSLYLVCDLFIWWNDPGKTLHYFGAASRIIK